MESLINMVRDFLNTNIGIGANALSATWAELIFAFILPLVGVFLLIRVIAFFVKRLVRKSQLTEATQTRVLKWMRLANRLIFLVLVIVLGSNLLGDQIAESLASVITFLREPFFTSGNTQISVVTLLLLVPIFYTAAWAGNSSRKLLERGVLDRLNLDASRQFSILSLVRYSVMAIVVVIGLSIVGINLSSLAVIFGVLGIGLGFGLQGVISNLFAGIMIILSRPIKEGDRIHIGDMEGDVQHIRILYTVVKTVTEETIIIPNSQIVENNVHNQSYDNPSIVLVTPVQVAYSSDLDQVKDILIEVGQQNEFLNPGKDPRVLFRSFDDSGITVALAVPIASAVQRHLARSSVVLDIWRAFKAHSIEIPFPQRDLNVRSMPESVETMELSRLTDSEPVSESEGEPET